MNLKKLLMIHGNVLCAITQSPVMKKMNFIETYERNYIVKTSGIITNKIF